MWLRKFANTSYMQDIESQEARIWDLCDQHSDVYGAASQDQFY
jgi:hypothetical protein